MKLIRFGEPGREKPGILDDGGVMRDVSAFTPDYDEEFFEQDGLTGLRRWLRVHEAAAPPVDISERLGPPIARPSKIVCVGLNYAQHAAEGGMTLPSEPILFFKAPSAVCGPYDDIIIPKYSVKTDWEVELALVIGKRASYVDEAEAMDHVAGYVLHNDVSERAFQLERHGQWVKGKSADTFAPLGPYLVTTDEIDDPHRLALWLKVNGETLQSSTTEDLIFDLPYLVSYISQFMTLCPGDVISTGTPSGVGLGLKPPRYLKPGDVVELGIDGLGVAKQHVRAFAERGYG